VANFLNYVNAGRYAGTFFHRNIPGFVLQGGGYTYDVGTNTAPHITDFPQVMNEFGISNLRGTIAMAKLAPPPEGPPNGGPNSATSEFFFNLSNSNAGTCPLGLDCQNGGFTVFGRVVGNGMTVVDSIVALPSPDIDGGGQTFNSVPLRGDNSMTLANRLVFLNSVSVLNLPAGDYDFNGLVNSADYTVWRNSFGSTTNAAADGNGNGRVDGADYVVWRNSLSGSGAGAGGVESGGVPEPASAFLLLCSGLMLAARRGRRAHSGPVKAA
jgi:peptidyl-prolyl cis-trans isomerase A (cyclophilin A)